MGERVNSLVRWGVVQTSGADMELNGKVAIVTGARGDIGGAICELFAREGVRLVSVDITGEDSDGPDASGILNLKCDISSPEEVEAAIGRAMEVFGRLDILVNNAALFGPYGNVVELDLAEWNRSLAVNLTGTMLMSRSVVPAMRANGGSIIHLASQLSHVGRAGRACYGMTKAGLRHLAKVMAIDHAQDNIRVNSLSPGPFATKRLISQYGGAEAHAAKVGPMTVLGRAGRVEEIANAALFLASERSSYMTGADLLVDGGFTIR